MICSAVLGEKFKLEVLPIGFAVTIEEIERLNLSKFMKSLGLALRLLFACVARRPDLVYFILTATGRAFHDACRCTRPPTII